VLRPARPLQRREIAALALFAVIALAQGWTGAAITHVLPFVQDDYSLSDAAVFDLMMLIRFVGGLDTPAARDLILGDMNGDNVLDVRDVLLLRRSLGY